VQILEVYLKNIRTKVLPFEVVAGQVRGLRFLSLGQACSAIFNMNLKTFELGSPHLIIRLLTNQYIISHGSSASSSPPALFFSLSDLQYFPCS